MQHLSCLTGITDLCLLHNPRLAVDDACVAAVARLPNIKILGLGNHQVCVLKSSLCHEAGCCAQTSRLLLHATDLKCDMSAGYHVLSLLIRHILFAQQNAVKSTHE